jgi:hypothetical protein
VASNLRCWVWSSIRLPREPKNSCLSLAPRADSRFQKQQIHNSQLFVIIPAAAVAYSLSYLQIIRKPRGDKQTRLGLSERKKNSIRVVRSISSAACEKKANASSQPQFLCRFSSLPAARPRHRIP